MLPYRSSALEFHPHPTLMRKAGAVARTLQEVAVEAVFYLSCACLAMQIIICINV